MGGFNSHSSKSRCKIRPNYLNCKNILQFLTSCASGRIPEASAKLRYFSLIMSLGFRNPFFFLGLLFNFSMMLLTY
ncbi:hypothetical protein, partial [Sodaliphilus pleomorphus]|uniref:hypothetical protein n=1 Tax=Sodaliphilus pleomorphus TaxID=2606626 RepID=UPI00197EA94D